MDTSTKAFYLSSLPDGKRRTASVTLSVCLIRIIQSKAVTLESAVLREWIISRERASSSQVLINKISCSSSQLPRHFFLCVCVFFQFPVHHATKPVSFHFQEHLSVSHNSLSTLHGELSSLPNLRVSGVPTVQM